jgi:hypothetical protein
LPGIHIPCTGTSVLHGLIFGVRLDELSVLPDIHIHCTGTSVLHGLIFGVP